MKMGMRRPSVKRSISARTTGKLKRNVKKSVNPLYGKKGMGYANDPKKALYNSAYNKTTFGTKQLLDENTATNTNTKIIDDYTVDNCTNDPDSTDKAVGCAAGIYVGIYCAPLLFIGIFLFIMEFYFASILFFGIYAIIIWIVYYFAKNK